MRISSKRLIRAAGMIVAGLVIAAGAAFAQTAQPAQIVVPKFETFNQAKYKGPTGTIVFPGAGKNTLVLRKMQNGNPGDYLTVTGNDKNLVVPVGKYRMQYATFSLAVGSRTTWTTFVSNNPDKTGFDFEALSGKEVEIPAVAAAAVALGSKNFGICALPYDGESTLVLTGLKSYTYIQIFGKAKTLLVPVGEPFFYTGSYVVKDEKGAKWSISTEARARVDAKDGSEIKLASFEPLTASVKVTQATDKVSMSLTIADSEGKICVIRPVDPKAEAPSFEVVNNSGKVIMSGKFAYG